MDIRKCTSSTVASLSQTPRGYLSRIQSKSHFEEKAEASGSNLDSGVDIDLREVYFLIMHFLSAGPCQKTFEQLCNELMEYQLLPRRYHAWFSRSGEHSGHSYDDGISCPLSYNKLVERNPHIEKDHLLKLLKQLFLSTASPAFRTIERTVHTAADVPTLLGTGSFALLESDRKKRVDSFPAYLRWPHMHADQVRGLSLRQIGGGFTKHHRAPCIQSASYVIVKPSTMVQKMQNIKKLRGHRDAVYCAIFDRSGRYVITGSDDRLVKIWSIETALCLTSCRGHEGDITDLAVSSNNAVVASASNDFVIRVWRLPDGMPVSVLRGHTAAVTTIAFSPRPTAPYHLLSSSDDGTCRVWDVRFSNYAPQIYAPKPIDAMAGRNANISNSGPSSSNNTQSHQILCCAYNATGTYFVTGSSDTIARVWNATRVSFNDPGQTVHEMDILSGHENDVNYVQFSGCAIAPRSLLSDALKEENVPKFRNSWFCHDSIVTCSRDGSAIIWVPKSRKSLGKAGRWIRAYHLKVPPPPLTTQPARGGPRQRLLPTPRGVNMIVWSLDNRFVLAAIMDCRICVWNAVDGSLVHSLIGHSASSYVLDVHPFNPRIAMSAGYDGKTIVWDIWEGIPIWTYELGRFKLVDGKFSPDGTSIVLSDEVGQIYLLNTGQGDCQKDAKYDQFFLGDYRPLIRDTSGYVLDQETQLPPHKRNIQDPLCDSGMIPYPEPYQSMYQRRRLGALGMEWRPSSINFAVGPDFSLGQDYQMPSLEDLERMIEPIPDFIDPLAWEPEIEVISDDNDSEYNVTEEYSSEGEKKSFSDNTTSSESSAEEVEVGSRHREGIFRLKKKKHKIEDELATSSRRRSKRQNLDEHDGTVSRAKKAKISRSVRKASNRRSPKAKTMRSQRLAARNALNVLSQVSETSTDEEDEYDSEDYTSESEFQPHYLNNQDNSHVDIIPGNHSREQSFLNEGVNNAKPTEPPASQSNVEKKRKLVLRIPNRKYIERPKACHAADESDRQEVEEELGTDRLRDPEGLRNSDLLPGHAHRHLSTELSAMHDHHSERAAPAVCSEEQSIHSGSGNVGDCGLQIINNINGDKHHSQELKENPPRKFPKFKIKMRSSNLKFSAGLEEQTNILSGGTSRAVGSSSSKLLHPADKGKSFSEIIAADDFDGDIQGSSTLHPGNHHHIGVDSLEDAVAVVRKTRSSRNKTSWEANAVNHNLVARGTESAGTSRTAFNNLNPYAELSYKAGIPRWSTKNKQFDIYESDQRSADGRHASGKKVSWLMLVEHEENYRYIPQLGDEVAYLRQGHQEFIESSGSRELGPWSKNRGLRAVEMCKVEELDYATVSGSGESCCKLTLRFLDRECTAYSKTFKLTLPELMNFPDFIIERSRYIAAVKRKWIPGDKCMVWWNLDGECRNGSWYIGHIDYFKAKSEEFPDSPWERYYVLYENDGDESHGHSPWELHDPSCDYLWVHPEMDSESRGQLLSNFSKFEREKKREYYGIERLNRVAKKLDFCNRFPVPLSPFLIQLRLENNYYRSLAAVKHDVKVMLSNAESYFSRNTEMFDKIRHLTNFFNRAFSGL